jgi:hypothetical protein
MSFEAVLGNKEFEFVISEVTLTVVTRRSALENEQKYPWLYNSVVHKGYLCKFCELFCGHSFSSQEFVTVVINLGTV